MLRFSAGRNVRADAAVSFVTYSQAPRAINYSYRGTSLIRKRTPPYDHHRALGVTVLQDPTGWHFLMSEVPLYIATSVAARVLLKKTALLLACALMHDSRASATISHPKTRLGAGALSLHPESRAPPPHEDPGGATSRPSAHSYPSQSPLTVPCESLQHKATPGIVWGKVQAQGLSFAGPPFSLTPTP